MAQSERLYWIDGQIRSQRYPNASFVAARFEVSLRTAFNDARYLKERLGAPLLWNKRRGGWDYRDHTFALPFLALSDAEANALRRTLLAAWAYLPPADAQATARLSARLSPYVRGLPIQGMADGGGATFAALSAGPDIMDGQIRLATPDLPSDALLADVRRALDEKRKLRITYYSAHKNEVTERVIRPYNLLNWRGEIYCIAHCELRDAPRDFFLPRIRAHAVLDPPYSYEIAPDFDAAQYLRSAFELRRGDPETLVRIRFTEYQSRWVRERIYHPTQQIEEQPDGGLILSVTVSGVEEIRRWILSFGSEAAVLEPESLREALRESIVGLKKIYEQSYRQKN